MFLANLQIHLSLDPLISEFRDFRGSCGRTRPETSRRAVIIMSSLVTRPKYPYRETCVAIPLSHYVLCVISQTIAATPLLLPVKMAYRRKTPEKQTLTAKRGCLGRGKVFGLTSGSLSPKTAASIYTLQTHSLNLENTTRGVQISRPPRRRAKTSS